MVNDEYNQQDVSRNSLIKLPLCWVIIYRINQDRGIHINPYKMTSLDQSLLICNQHLKVCLHCCRSGALNEGLQWVVSRLLEVSNIRQS